MISSLGMSTLSYVKMDSNRNILIVGLSLFMAVGVPGYFRKNPGHIDTGMFSYYQPTSHLVSFFSSFFFLTLLKKFNIMEVLSFDLHFLRNKLVRIF